MVDPSDIADIATLIMTTRRPRLGSAPGCPDRALGRSTIVPTGATKCNDGVVTFRSGELVGTRAVAQARHHLLSEDRVDALVADVFFVVEGADVGGDECFDAVPEASGGFGERHAGAEPCRCGGVAAVVDAYRFLAD